MLGDSILWGAVMAHQVLHHRVFGHVLHQVGLLRAGGKISEFKRAAGEGPRGTAVPRQPLEGSWADELPEVDSHRLAGARRALRWLQGTGPLPVVEAGSFYQSRSPLCADQRAGRHQARPSAVTTWNPRPGH